MLIRRPLESGEIELTFILPPDDPPGDVSVVGTFNGWEPGRHTLTLGPDGLRRVSVRVGPGTHRFRYLATGGVWRDEKDADLIDQTGSVVLCPAPPTGSAPPPATPPIIVRRRRTPPTRHIGFTVAAALLGRVRRS